MTNRQSHVGSRRADAPTEAEIRALGVRTDAVTAGRALGIGRSKTFELIRQGEFPVPVLRLGNKYVVPVAPILELLGLEPASTKAAA